LVAFAAASRRFEHSVVPAAIFFTSAGLLAGPWLGLIDLRIRRGRAENWTDDLSRRMMRPRA
jgi:hypothetical protein